MLMSSQISFSAQSSSPFATAQQDAAWIVFSDEATRFWGHCLKRGFRHCFMIQRGGAAGAMWQIIDLSRFPPKNLIVPLPADFDLPQWLRDQGLLVVEAPNHVATISQAITHTQSRKSGSGIQALLTPLMITPLLFTPWRLYKALKKGVR